MTREYKTRRGALLAAMEWRRLGDGDYIVESHSVQRFKSGVWSVCRLSPAGAWTTHESFTEALEQVAQDIGLS